MLEWINRRIRLICHRLEFSLFLPLKIRQKLERELDKLLKMREKHDETKQRMDDEERAKLKDPDR
jgi:hypothetical protein